MDDKEKREQSGMKKLLFPLVAVVIIVLLCAVAVLTMPKAKEEKREVITVPTLEKIINVSDLSTFTAVYNGIAVVNNEKKPEKIDYYVSYEARVNAGIDVEKIAISVDNEGKVIRIELPQVHITDVNVNLASLDFIFVNDKANTSSVSAQAYKVCEEDVHQESQQQNAIFELAKQNAVNIVTALTKPIVEQLDSAYTLEVQ